MRRELKAIKEKPEAFDIYKTVADHGTFKKPISVRMVQAYSGDQILYKRQIRKLRRYLCHHGIPVVYSSTKGGYYIAKTRKGLLEARREHRSRIRKISKELAAIERAYLAFNGIQKQLKIKGA